MSYVRLNISGARNLNGVRHGRSLALSLAFRLYALALYALCIGLLVFGLWICSQLLVGYLFYFVCLSLTIPIRARAHTAWIISKRYLALDAKAALSRDPRAPVLYLRSFFDQFTGNDLWIHVESDEEFIYPVLRRLGPVIAVGQPGEVLPPLGASRFYVEAHEDWQGVVKEYEERSQLLIISPSDSEGVLWEIGTAFKLNDPKKVLLSLISFQPNYPTYKDGAYERYREAIYRELSISLPGDIGTALFMAFDEAWNPVLLRPEGAIAGLSKRLDVWDVIQRWLQTRDIELRGLFPLIEASLASGRVVLWLVLYVAPFLVIYLFWE